MDERERELLLAAENALSSWQAYRICPAQYYAETCNAMRRLDAAAEAYGDEEILEPSYERRAPERQGEVEPSYGPSEEPEP